MCFNFGRKRPSFDFAAQPHLAPDRGDIPPVVGRNFSGRASIGYDPRVYPAEGETAAPPAYLSPLAAGAAQKAIAAIAAYLAPLGLAYSPQQSKPTILIKFYYAPWTARWTSAALTGPVLPPFNEQLVISPKATASAASPPGRYSNLLGLCYLSAVNKDIRGAVIYINAYPWEDLRLQALARPDLRIDWQRQGDETTDLVIWHETFHTVGLNDQPRNSAPRLMGYQVRSSRPSAEERAVVEWLY